MKITLNGKDFEVRKWKGRDKKNFLELVKGGELTPLKTLEVLVDSCIENRKDETFSLDEYRYILTEIRKNSLGDELEVNLTCESCQEDFIYEYNISDVVQPVHEDLKPFVKGGTEIQFGKIKNQKIYVEKVSERKESEILFRIEKFDGDDTFTLESLEDKLDDLDLDILESLVQHFESGKFHIDNVKEIPCPHCQHVNKLEFDELPNFFPESWFKTTFESMVKEKGLSETVGS